MNDLTPEERLRIYKEEIARLEIRREVEAEFGRLRERLEQPGQDACSGRFQDAYYQALAHRREDPAPPPPKAKSNGIAALLSVVMPGAGHMYKEKVGVGFAWFFGTAFAYAVSISVGAILF